MKDTITLTVSHRGGKKSTTFTGRPEGIQVRENLHLEEKDTDDKQYRIVMPNDTTSFNASFYLGLFFSSMEHLGWDKFKEKYQFDFSNFDDDELREVLEENINNCRRKALNELNCKSAL